VRLYWTKEHLILWDITQVVKAIFYHLFFVFIIAFKIKNEHDDIRKDLFFETFYAFRVLFVNGKKKKKFIFVYNTNDSTRVNSKKHSSSKHCHLQKNSN